MTENPFAPTSIVSDDKGICGDAKLVRSSFLYRVIDLPEPVSCRMTYSGWWFVQRIWLDNRRVWTKISWLNLSRNIEFRLPTDPDGSSKWLRIEILFRPGLMIRRFRVWIDDQLEFDQLN